MKDKERMIVFGIFLCFDEEEKKLIYYSERNSMTQQIMII